MYIFAVLLALSMHYVVLQTQGKKCKWLHPVSARFLLLALLKDTAATLQENQIVWNCCGVASSKLYFNNNIQDDFNVVHPQHISCNKKEYDDIFSRTFATF